MISREERIIFCLVIAIFVFMVFIVRYQIKVEKLEEQLIVQMVEPAQEVITGEYTIIHYPNGGWINSIHITEYYIDGNLMWFMEKGSTEYKPVWVSEVLPADGWLEGKELVKYGYWISELEFE